MTEPLGRLRSLLFAPAARPDLVAKLPGTGADGVVIDCEDATPAAEKEVGRSNARRLSGEISGRGPHVFVRINAVPTRWFSDDITGGLGEGLAAVVVPKVETRDQLDRVAAVLGEAGRDLGVIAGIETARGVADSRSLLAHPVVVAGYFGAEDYVADLGGVRTPDSIEVLYARSKVALAGRLAGAVTIDQVVTDYHDDDAFRHEAAQARAMGFRGKLCIHPAQVAIANAAFVPSSEEIERARRLLRAYDEAVDRGVGAVGFEGQMVDEALAAQARAVISSAEADS